MRLFINLMYLLVFSNENFTFIFVFIKINEKHMSFKSGVQTVSSIKNTHQFFFIS